MHVWVIEHRITDGVRATRWIAEEFVHFDEEVAEYERGEQERRHPTMEWRIRRYVPAEEKT